MAPVVQVGALLLHARFHKARGVTRQGQYLTRRTKKFPRSQHTWDALVRKLWPWGKPRGRGIDEEGEQQPMTQENLSPRAWHSQS